MKKTILTTVAAVLTAFFVSQGIAAGVHSLRGDAALEATNKDAPREGRLVTERGGFDRNYKQQPPLIPHKLDRVEINLKVNRCLKCHSKENHEKEKAPEVGKSHYLDANGNKQDTISMRRYFCTQCHIPQMNAEPLVENTFKSK